MICQYCHSNTHTINSCPTIICRYCKQSGHPKWLCINKEIKNKNINNKKMIEKNIQYYLKIQNYKWSDIINNL